MSKNTNAWIARIWAEFHARNLTPGQRDTLLCLNSFRGRHGDCWPSHETVAKRARYCIRTVHRALNTARQLGLINWKERRKWSGWRWLRTSNEYRFLVPTGPIERREIPKKPRVQTTGHFCSGEESVKVSKNETVRSLAQERRTLDAVTNDPAWLQSSRKAVAQVQSAMEERLLKRWNTRQKSAALIPASDCASSPPWTNGRSYEQRSANLIGA
jgi:hypothetical protein